MDKLISSKANVQHVRLPSELSVLYLITICALVLFFVFDGLTKILFTYSFDFHRASLIIRTLYEGLFIFLIIIYLNHTRSSLIIAVLCLLLIFSIGQIFLISNIGFYDAYWESIILFNKYVFIFIIYCAIYKLKNDQEKLDKCISVLETIFIINSIAILLGPITGFEFLKSYIHSDYRYGYMGFILAQNEATLYYFLAVSLSYYKRFILKIPSKGFLFIVGAALLLGTKGIYGFLILLFLFHFLFHSGSKVWLLLGFSFALIQLIRFAQSEKGEKYFIYFFNETARRNWFSMLLSGRDLLLKENFQAQLNEWSLINYLTGGQRYSTELDFFDLLLFFGVIGGGIFLSLYFFTIFRFGKTRFTIFFIICYFSLAFFGGHFFSSATNALYLCLICLYFYASQNRIKLQGG